MLVYFWSFGLKMRTQQINNSAQFSFKYDFPG